jgi:hypothetical protein
MFVYSFFDVVMNELASTHELVVVILRRYLPSILKSRMELGHLGRDGGGNLLRTQWVATTNCASAVVSPLGECALVRAAGLQWRDRAH